MTIVFSKSDLNALNDKLGGLSSDLSQKISLLDDIASKYRNDAVIEASWSTILNDRSTAVADTAEKKVEDAKAGLTELNKSLENLVRNIQRFVVENSDMEGATRDRFLAQYGGEELFPIGSDTADGSDAADVDSNDSPEPSDLNPMVKPENIGQHVAGK